MTVPDPEGTGVYYPFEGGEAFASRFYSFIRCYSGDLQNANRIDSAGYIEFLVGDATGRATISTDPDHYEGMDGSGYNLLQGDYIKISVNGGPVKTVTFPDMEDASAEQVAAVINAVFPNLARKITYDLGNVKAQLCLKASHSIQIAGGNARAKLGFNPWAETVTRNHIRWLSGEHVQASYAEYQTHGNLFIKYEMLVRGQLDWYPSESRVAPTPDRHCVVGVNEAKAGDISASAVWGISVFRPIAITNCGLSERTPTASAPVSSRDDTSCHEVGHSLMRHGDNIRDLVDPEPEPLQSDDFHYTHTRPGTRVGGVPELGGKWSGRTAAC